ncbi:MAP7 domain-containing protein 1-like [Haliotis asinina]|uniref:MAP7 domain-containing protein 1-like n=1 Tax=Haliotis asinina TaxID=109174 RepID=UPI00353197B9
MACMPTLCEISYDSDLFDEERFSTPFRISGNCSGKSRGYGIISGEFASFGFEKLQPVQCHASKYSDYLRSYYIEQTILKNGGNIRSPTLPSRSPTRFTWCDPIEDEDATSRDNPPQVVRDQLSLPAHLKSSARGERGEGPTYRKGSGKIVWVDALNSWVPYKKPVQDKAYVSFVNTPPIIEKCFTTVGRQALQNRNTSKKSPDGSTWKQNRKAYSTPLSNAESRRICLPPRAPSAGPSFPQPTPLENVHPAWRSPDTHEGDTVETDAERFEQQELFIPSPDTAGDTGQSVDNKPLETRDSDEERSVEAVTSVADPTPADSSDKKETSSTGGLANKQQVQPAPPPPPPRPLAASRGQTKSKKSSPRKPATSKPNRSPKKPSKVKSPPQQQKTARPTAKQKKVSSDDKPQPLPISLPVVTAQPPHPSPPSVDSDRGSSEHLDQVRSPIKKRERVVSRRPCKTEEAANEHVPEGVQVKKSADWIYEEKVDETHTKAEENVHVKLEETVLPTVIPCPPSTHSQTTISRVQRKLQAFRQPIQNKSRWGPKTRDTSYEDELRKQELAEARRKRQAEMLERKKKKKFGQKMEEEGMTGIPNFEDYGFLAKYCILSRTNLEMYKHAFQAVDDENRGWLTGTEAMIALRGTNNRLTETEEEYLYRILEMTGYSITNGADFKLFSLLAALSQRIAALDKWMKNLIGQVDFKMLDMKMFKCKTLWECNVDGDTNKISLEQLMIELRAGGVSYQHECEVREKLRHLVALDLLDFLTYVPLFIMIHESVVDNPLDDTREK